MALTLANVRPLSSVGLKSLRAAATLPMRDLDNADQDDFAHVEPAGARFLRRPTRRIFETANYRKFATAQIGQLPAEGEDLHLTLSGTFPLWSLIPSILALTGQVMKELQSLTLSFSRDNVGELCDLLDNRRILRADIITSHYFKHSNDEIYTPAATALAERGQRLHACRNHAKIFNVLLADGRTFTVESSANWRSCKNIETATVIADRALFDHHHRWIDKLFPTERPTP